MNLIDTWLRDNQIGRDHTQLNGYSAALIATVLGQRVWIAKESERPILAFASARQVLETEREQWAAVPVLQWLDMKYNAAAAAVVGVALGAAGSFLLPPRGLVGFFSLLLALVAGSGAGSSMAGAVTRATHAKRGLPMQLTAVGGIVLAAAVRLAPFVLWDGIERARGDAIGLLLVVVASIVTWGRLH